MTFIEALNCLSAMASRADRLKVQLQMTPTSITTLGMKGEKSRAICDLDDMAFQLRLVARYFIGEND